jgi:hypothetical protein
LAGTAGEEVVVDAVDIVGTAAGFVGVKIMTPARVITIALASTKTIVLFFMLRISMECDVC